MKNPKDLLGELINFIYKNKINSMIIHKSIDLEPLFPTEVHLIIGDT